MNERIFANPIVIGTLASDPGTAYNGEMYYSSGLSAIRVYLNGTWSTLATGATGVTTVSVVTANGFAGSVANPTSTPAITISTTITGLLQGNGTAISAYTGGNLTDSTSGADGITVTNGSGAVIGSGTSIAQAQASGSQNGYLASSDWTNFNNTYLHAITALTGDATATGPGSVALTLATVNSNVGSFGSSTSIPSFTVNGKGLITAASGNAVIAPAGTLSGSTLNSTVTSSSLTSLGTQSQNLNMGSNAINNVADPTNAQDAATKHYVDLAVAGIQWKDEVQAYAASNVPLTGSTPLVIDGYTVQNGDSLMLANQTTSSQNGVYTISIVISSYTLTLRSDSNPPSIGFAYLVENGTAYQYTAWVVSALSPTMFVQFAGPQELVFDAPLSRSGNDVSLLYGNGLTLSSNTLVVESADASISVASGGISVVEDPAGAIVTGVSGIKVQTDGSTISINGSNQLYVPSQGITSTQIANGAVGTTQLATNSVTNSILAQMAANTLKGNNTGSTANAADLTVAQVTAMIGVTTATASSLVERDSSGNTYQNQVNAQASSGPQSRMSTDGSNWLEEQYVNSITLTAGNSNTAVDASLTFAYATYSSYQAQYYLTDASSPTIVRSGRLTLVANSNGTTSSLNDEYATTASIGVTFSAVTNGSNIQLNYSNTNATNVTMRVKITRFLR